MKHTFLTFSDTAKSQVPSRGKHEMASCPGWSEIPESWPVVTECTREGWGVRSGIFLPPSGCLRSPNPSTSRVPNERHIGTWDNHINKCWIWCGNSCFCTKEILVCKNPWETSRNFIPNKPRRTDSFRFGGQHTNSTSQSKLKRTIIIQPNTGDV